MRVFITILILGILSSTALSAKGKQTIEIFHKNMPPSITTLSKVLPMVNQYNKDYRIILHEINNPALGEIIKAYGLPSTHFPFAVVVNGKYTAKIDGKEVGFVHFPKFMHGIGRHEGNWSIEMLEKVLQDNMLLADENRLPVIDEHDEEDEECQD